MGSEGREELELMSVRDRMITEKGTALNTVTTVSNSDDDGGHMGHCRFTSLDDVAPLEGALYAGYSDRSRK